ncbi:MAG: alpha/beta hydrolase [Dehalococcoidaceae bacterium]|nr:alpha/beta hydrolase [Dehalococcoidaceae bacterium]
MTAGKVTTGYTRNGLPYGCFGRGKRNLVVFEGLSFEHKPPSRFTLRMSIGFLKVLEDEYRIYLVNRKPGLPKGYTLAEMAHDYACMVRDELGGRADIMGISTGGAIALEFATIHPALVRRLVLVMTGCYIKPEAKKLQMEVAQLAGQGRRRKAASLLGSSIHPTGVKKSLFSGLFWLMGPMIIPGDASDGIVEIEAEDRLNMGCNLSYIRADTLVIGGEDDFFYPIKETAAGIPNARLVLYPGIGHNAMFAKGREFGEEIKAFLLAE